MKSKGPADEWKQMYMRDMGKAGRLLKKLLKASEDVLHAGITETNYKKIQSEARRFLVDLDLYGEGDEPGMSDE